MSPRDEPILIMQAPRGPFPRPNLTMRELIGLVLAFAISNAFLAWASHGEPIHPAISAFWNGVLASYLGLAFLQSWVRSILRWIRTGHAEPRRRRPQRWTALGVAEATVIGGTMIWCIAVLPMLASRQMIEARDWSAPLIILALGSAAGIMVLRMWRNASTVSPATRRIETLEVGQTLQHEETL